MVLKLINLWQSSEERRAKYHLCKSLGANAAWAMRMRDWRLIKIERRYGLPHSPEALTEEQSLS